MAARPPACYVRAKCTVPVRPVAFAPNTYQWSGLGSGSDASTQVTMNAPGDLFLDVWDANGQHVALSTYVNMSCSGGFVC